jgi:type I restriction enzyme M protein
MRIIIQSHVKRLRVGKNNILDCYLLFYLLNTDIVRKQIEAKTFVQATISSIGSRLREIILVIPQNKAIKKQISEEIKDIIQSKMRLKKRSMRLFEGGI